MDSFPIGRRASRPTRSLWPLGASLLIAVLVFAADQFTKWLAHTYLPEFPGQSVPVLGDAVRLTYVMNRGAAFGVLQDQNAFFIVVSGVVILVIIGSYRYSAMRSPLVTVALGMQLGGAVGNLIDRLRFGYVVDFIDLSVWPVFNLADSGIVLGVTILAYHLLRSSDTRGSRAEETRRAGP